MQDASQDSYEVIIAHLNLRAQPIHRGTVFEDPLHDALNLAGIGHVSGGGSDLMPNGDGIFSCDIKIGMINTLPQSISQVITLLEILGAPKGSEILSNDRAPIPFGVTEGMGVFLELGHLPDDAYQVAIKTVLDAILARLGDRGKFVSWWENNRETALYFYGPHFSDMKEAVMASGITETHLRIEQVA